VWYGISRKVNHQLSYFYNLEFWVKIILKPQDYKKFENFVKLKFPFKAIDCTQFLRHKTILINPYKLKKVLPEISIHK
jgi:hypothetical protein